MGKNKGGPKSKGKREKDAIVFKVAGVRKTKTKIVLKHLKKSNFLTRAKTQKADEKLAEIRNTLIKGSGECSSKPHLKKEDTKVLKSAVVSSSEMNQPTEGESKL